MRKIKDYADCWQRPLNFQCSIYIPPGPDDFECRGSCVGGTK